MFAIRTGNFPAEPWRRKDFAWIAQAFRIERVPHRLHHVEAVLREHLRHELFLVGTDAVLTRDRSTGFDAVDQNLSRDPLRQLGLPFDALVVTDQRMQIAIAGVEHIPDAKTFALAERPDAPEHFG